LRRLLHFTNRRTDGLTYAVSKQGDLD
jgi:hypothetical protein